MKKVLFLIHDLGQGGAEKVLINLVNNMDQSKFDITVIALFGGGVNEGLLSPKIHFQTVFPKMIPGNSKLMKLLTPYQLHKLFVKDDYDIEISYLEGPSARVISGCRNKKSKLITWIHSNHFSMKQVSSSFRSKREAINCYNKFDRIVCVSRFMKSNFCQWIPCKDKCSVLYNTVESDVIVEKSQEMVDDITISNDIVNLIAMGTLKKVKGFDRLFKIIKRLKNEKFRFRLYVLGEGPLRKEYEQYIRNNQLQDTIILLGYRMNPYKYIFKCDLFICSSYSEGFSTAVTEALIVGTPVCTVEVSGMKELLGDNNEYGIITKNDADSLYEGIKNILEHKELIDHYRIMAKERGLLFNKENTVKKVETLLEEI